MILPSFNPFFPPQFIIVAADGSFFFEAAGEEEEKEEEYCRGVQDGPGALNDPFISVEQAAAK